MIKSIFTSNQLFEKNRKFIAEYQYSPLMELVRSNKVNNSQVRTEILDCIQTFSNYFQKAVMLRYVTTEHSSVALVAAQHLDEEFKHNEALAKDRSDKSPKWDPILEATSCWFAWKMLTLDNIEKTALMHLVLETSADIFFCAADKVMKQFGETNYFSLHADLDEQHAAMGERLLLNLSEAEYQRLGEVLDTGWAMLIMACNRIATLAEAQEEPQLQRQVKQKSAVA
jgi:hypothetical protein